MLTRLIALLISILVLRVGGACAGEADPWRSLSLDGFTGAGAGTQHVFHGQGGRSDAVLLDQVSTPGDRHAVYRITQPGQYRLASTFSVPWGKCGVDIASDGVELDLGGFAIVGGEETFDGVRVSIINARDVVVRNGWVLGMGRDGLNLAAAQAPHVEQVSAIRNAEVGIRVGAGSVVTGTLSRENGLEGVIAGDSAVLSFVESSLNGGAGIVTGGKATVRTSIAEFNSGSGLVMGPQAEISDTRAPVNRGEGIVTGPNSSIRGSSATYNGRCGILPGKGSSIVDCLTVFNQGEGISGQDDLRIEVCLAMFNSATAQAYDVRDRTSRGAIRTASGGITGGTGTDAAGLRGVDDGTRTENPFERFDDY